MKVLLIDPVTPCDGQINIGLVYLASYISSLGHVVRMVDMNFHRQDSYQRMNQSVVDLTPDVIGISIISYFAFNEVRKIVKRLREDTGCPIVVGGSSPTMCSERILTENKDIDFSVMGEGELTFAELLDTLSQKSQDFSRIKGLVYRSNDKVIVNDKRPLISNLDTLPMLNFDLIDIVAKYGFKYYMNTYTMATTRGCPYNCSFCLSNVLCGRRWRCFSAQRVVDEIEAACRKYGLRTVSFQDDNFVMRPQRVVEICRLIRERGLRIKLRLDGGIRADRLTAESLDALCSVGIEAAILAVESGSPKVFGMIDKGESLETIEHTIVMLKSANVTFPIFMILGLPGDTHEMHLESVAFAKKHNLKCLWHFALPFEGTQMYDWVVANGRFLRDCTGYDIDIVSGNDITTPGTFPLAFDTPEYPASQRITDYYKAVIDSETFFYILGAKYKSKVLCALRCLFMVLKYKPDKLGAYVWNIMVLGTRYVWRRMRGL